MLMVVRKYLFGSRVPGIDLPKGTFRYAIGKMLWVSLDQHLQRARPLTCFYVVYLSLLIYDFYISAAGTGPAGMSNLRNNNIRDNHQAYNHERPFKQRLTFFSVHRALPLPRTMFNLSMAGLSAYNILYFR